MRTFAVLALLAIAAFWGARETPPGGLPWEVLRFALYVASGVFALLLVSAIVQALVGAE